MFYSFIYINGRGHKKTELPQKGVVGESLHSVQGKLGRKKKCLVMNTRKKLFIFEFFSISMYIFLILYFFLRFRYMLGEPSKKRSVKKMQVFCCGKKIYIFAHMCVKLGGGAYGPQRTCPLRIQFFYGSPKINEPQLKLTKHIFYCSCCCVQERLHGPSPGNCSCCCCCFCCCCC